MPLHHNRATAPTAATPPRGGGELDMARAAVPFAAALAPPAVALAYVLRGPRAALTAAAAVALVVGWYAVTGWSLAWAGRRGTTTYAAVAFGGFAARVVGLGVAAAVLSPLDVVDGPTLALTVAAAVVVLLVAATRDALRRPERWWVDIPDGKDRA